jgi:hypothetical protein
LKAVAKAFNDLPEPLRRTALARLERIRSRAKHIGWGYGDFVDDIVTMLERHRAPSTRSRTGQP